MKNLHQTIKEQVVAAMRAKDTVRLETLRSLIALFMNEMLAAKLPAGTAFLPDDKALVLIKRASKQHKDSIEQFSKGGREDLVTNEEAELRIIDSFLPQLMSHEEVVAFIRPRLAELKAAGSFDPKASGMLVGAFMKELAGKADGGDVKAAIEELSK